MPANEGILSLIHEKLAQSILDKLEQGELCAADITAISKFLKDNNVEALPEHNKPLQAIAKKLPTAAAGELDDEDDAPIPFPISK